MDNWSNGVKRIADFGLRNADFKIGILSRFL